MNNGTIRDTITDYPDLYLLPGTEICGFGNFRHMLNPAACQEAFASHGHIALLQAPNAPG